MIPVGGDSWTFRTSDDPEIELCVWALVTDGLRVPPFEHHPDGDGSLRSAGLTPESWTAWLAAVIDATAGSADRRQSAYMTELERFLREHGRPRGPGEGPRYQLEARASALDLWVGRWPSVGV